MIEKEKVKELENQIRLHQDQKSIVRLFKL